MIHIQWILCFIFTVLFIDKVRSQCSSTQSLSASYASSVIQSPGYNAGYNQNLACTWSITTSLSGASIIYQIRDIWISCSGDKVVTYDGTSDSATVIDDLCSSSGGGARGIIRVPSSGNVFLKFTTNANTDAAIEKGFQFFYTAAKDFSGSGCSGTQSITASSTDNYISSPSFPSKYPLSTTCNWAITAADNSERVYIEIIFIDVENDASCQYDYLRIRDGTIDTKICVTDWNYGTTYTSTGTNFDVTFYSDNAQDAQGFLLKYRQTQSLQSETRVNFADVASNGPTSTVVTTALPMTTTINIETTGHETSPELTGATTIAGLQSETRVNFADVASNGPTSTVVTTALPMTTTIKIETTGHETSPELTDATTIAAETTTQTLETTTEEATTVTNTVAMTTAGTTSHTPDTYTKEATTVKSAVAINTAETTTQTTTEDVTTRDDAETTVTNTVAVTSASTTSQMPVTTTSISTSTVETITTGTSATTTTSSVAAETTTQTQLSAASSVSCDETTCVLPAVLGTIIGTGVVSVAGLFIVMKAKGMIGKYSPGQNKVNIERGEGGDKKDKNEVDKNENVEDNNPDKPPPYITEKTAIDIVIDQSLENG